MKDLKHIKSFNEHQENLNSELSKKTSSSISDVSDSEKLIKVKHLIEYLKTLNPEADVVLDKDDWNYQNNELETLKRSFLFQYEVDFGEDGEDILFINN